MTVTVTIHLFTPVAPLTLLDTDGLTLSTDEPFMAWQSRRQDSRARPQDVTWYKIRKGGVGLLTTEILSIRDKAEGLTGLGRSTRSKEKRGKIHIYSPHGRERGTPGTKKRSIASCTEAFPYLLNRDVSTTTRPKRMVSTTTPW